MHGFTSRTPRVLPSGRIHAVVSRKYSLVFHSLEKCLVIDPILVAIISPPREKYGPGHSRFLGDYGLSHLT